MASAYYFSKQCFAYKRLKQQIGQQCMVYSKLRKDGELGSIPGMYETTKDGRWIPAETGAAPLLRGGIVTTMASFEAFLQDLLEEALDSMKYKRCNDTGAEKKHYLCPKCQNELDHKHRFITSGNADQRPYLPCSAKAKKKLTNVATPRMHVWNEQYSESFQLVEKTPESSHEELTKATVPKLGIKKLINDNICSALTVIDKKITTVQISCLEVKKRLKSTSPDQVLEQEQIELEGPVYGPAPFNYNNAREILLGIIEKCSCDVDNNAVDHEFKKLSDDSDILKQNLSKLSHDPDPEHYISPTAPGDYKFIKELFKDGPMNYHYLIDEKWISHMEIDSGYIICLLLNLFYGFRCIIGHGNSETTLNGTLKDFPKCNDKNNKCDMPPEILDVHHLSNIYDTCIKQQGKDKVLKTARKLPKKKPIENLGSDTAIAKEGLELLKKYFLNNDVVEWEDGRYSEKAPLHKNYALFHLFRVHHWLKTSPTEAYVTYHMLVRMNQFVLLLAHRMRFAVAKIMMDQPNALVEDGIWGVPKGDTERKTKIQRFEEKHQRRVKEIQKLTSCQN